MPDFLESIEEVKLISNILERLLSASSDNNVRSDQLNPLVQRLRRSATALESVYQETIQESSYAKTEAADAAAISKKGGVRGRDAKLSSDETVNPPAKNVKAKKPSSLLVASIPRATPPKDGLVVSKEVSRAFACSLYNILESTVNLLQASSASVFVKQGDEMVSIANVSSRLTFPPKVVRHRCIGSADAEVLGSGIALNQRINDSSRSCSGVLIFPVYVIKSLPEIRQRAIGTVHVETNHSSGTLHFGAREESLLLYCSLVIGEIFSRVPNMDWMESFYDPVTQHIVAPFSTVRPSALPLLYSKDGNNSTAKAGTKFTKDETRLAHDIESYSQEVLIKRESLPATQTKKSTVDGLTLMPSLREVQNYVENVQDCWKRNAVSNIALMEEDRCSQMQVKTLRRDLAHALQELAIAKESLRLYELEGGDYNQEYKDMHAELHSYLRKRDKMDDVP